MVAAIAPTTTEPPVMTEALVEEIVAECAPWEPNDENHTDTLAYLCSVLSSREGTMDDPSSAAAEEEEELFAIVEHFFEDAEASRKLVARWMSVTASKSERVHVAPRQTISKTSLDEATISTTTASTTAPKMERKTKSRSLKRERKTKKSPRSSTRREQRKAAKAAQSSPPTINSPAPFSSNDGSNDDDDDDIQAVVARIQEATALDLDELDDYSSAWRDAQAEGRVWGGRGFGGRGVNRGLGIDRGRDAVVNGLTLTLSGRELLTETRLVISNGHRYGLWGKNGVGKSTLLRRIANGNVPGWPMHISVRMVNQEVLGSTRSVKECMREIASKRNEDGKREGLEEELAELETVLVELADAGDSDAIEQTTVRMSDICEQLDQIEQHQQQQSNNNAGDNGGGNFFAGLEECAVAILQGLQFKGTMLDTPVNVLSGGWRMRVALAEALYSEPNILLLDEPTNHLDVSATIFLENYILENNLTIIVVSHDGHFLDAVCTDMIKFEDAKLTYHVGNYSTFREREEQLWSRNCGFAAAVARKEEKAKGFIQKQKNIANSKHRDDNRQRQAKEREKKLSRIGLYSENGHKFHLLHQGGSNASHINGEYKNSAGFTSLLVDNSQKSFGETKQHLNFRFPAATPLKGATGEYAPLITMEDCRFRYDTEVNTKKEGSVAPVWLLEEMTLNVSVGSRIAVIGKNAAGKTSLVKLLCGELSVKGGEFHSHPNLKIAHINQHHIEHLGSYLEHTPVEYFMIHHGAKNEHEVRQFLGSFGLVGQLALQLIGTLSGGQKARLAFATVMYNAPHVLILDEPTNHLDTDSLESLATAVNGFEGAVVMVSHNQHFLSQCAREMWTVGNGKVKVQAVDEESSTFDKLYGKYKENLRKEVLQAKKGASKT